jgi:hypothetical protein
MKTSVVKILAGSAIRLAVLSVLFLGMAGACMAQASAAPAQPAAQAAVAPQAHPAAQPAQKRVPGEPAAKGTHEGIKVHGHWTIETRNPDGKVVTHREFENSLYPPQTTLANLLIGQVSFGSWMVETATDSNANTGPCGNGTGDNTLCKLVQSGSGLAAANTTGNYFQTLQVTAPGSTVVQLTGTATALLNGQIGYVRTRTISCLPTISPSTCFVSAGGQQATPVLTTATLSTPVPVSAGQTIAVTVVISFQ